MRRRRCSRPRSRFSDGRAFTRTCARSCGPRSRPVGSGGSWTGFASTPSRSSTTPRALWTLTEFATELAKRRERARGPRSARTGRGRGVRSLGVPVMTFRRTYRWPASHITPHSRRDHNQPATRVSRRSANASNDLVDLMNILTLERHGARALGNRRVRVCVDSRHSMPRSASTTTSAAPAAASRAKPHDSWHESSSHA